MRILSLGPHPGSCRRDYPGRRQDHFLHGRCELRESDAYSWGHLSRRKCRCARHGDDPWRFETPVGYSRASEEDRLLRAIREAFGRGGSVTIPLFALGKAHGAAGHLLANAVARFDPHRSRYISAVSAPSSAASMMPWPVTRSAPTPKCNSCRNWHHTFSRETRSIPSHRGENAFSRSPAG